MWVVDSPNFKMSIKNPDCNEDKSIPFNRSVKGRQWMQNEKYGPFVHQSLALNGKPFDKPQADRADRPDQKYGPGAGKDKWGGGGRDNDRKKEKYTGNKRDRDARDH
jgi:hypothetical protein